MSAENIGQIWIALKSFPIERNGKRIQIQPGDEVPEVEGWPNRDYWEARRFIRKLRRAPKPVVESIESQSEAIRQERKSKAKPEDVKAKS